MYSDTVRRYQAITRQSVFLNFPAFLIFPMPPRALRGRNADKKAFLFCCRTRSGSGVFVLDFYPKFRSWK
jgi:hypothetical protein